MKKILFFSEAITLAHRMRPFVLANGLDRNKYQIGFASDQYYNELFELNNVQKFKITSLTPQQFQSAIWKGQKLYSYELLDKQVEEDLALLKVFKPDFVVSDFRLSLNISAKLAGIPMLNITNSYWHDYSIHDWEIPESIVTHMLGIDFPNFLFKKFTNLFLKSHIDGFKKVAKKRSVTGFENFDVRDLYLNGDKILFCDIEKFVSKNNLSPKNVIIGPLLWNSKVTKPSWWNQIQNSSDLIYLNLGSSGNKSLVPDLLIWLRSLNLNSPIIVGGTNNIPSALIDNKTFFSPFLPGLEICQKAKLVICNGGSPTTQQALSQGSPVIGVVSNIDQMLNMKKIEKFETGLSIRSDDLNKNKFIKLIENIYSDKKYFNNSQFLMKSIESIDVHDNFSNLLEAL